MVSGIARMTDDLTAGLQRNGYVLLPSLLSTAEIARLTESLRTVASDAALHRRGESVYACRHLRARVPEVQQFADSPAVRRLMASALGSDCFPVRSLFFDKTPGANWKVPWHQDRTIAVRERREVPGFAPWSMKAGVPHVQPPTALLARMLTLRLHLDSCDEDNGPLQVVPGSHAEGFLDVDAIREWRRRVAPAVCAVESGGVLLMRPLLLHASSPARLPGHRRVVHIEWAAESLPGGLEWYEQ